MKRLILACLSLAACARNQPAEHYGFIARLGQDTISLENVTRHGNTLTSDAVDRFPRVRQRHTEMSLAPDGGIRHLVMDITTPSEPENERERHVVADVTGDSVIMTKRDGTGSKRWTFATHGATVMAHVPQMYSLYELYFASALHRMAASPSTSGDTAQMRQFYIDREFDRFSLHHATVHRLGAGKAEIWHDWLAGIGEATVDSAGRMLHYSGARTTYKVDVARLSEPPNVQPVAVRFAALEKQKGGVTQLSVRDTARASIGLATFAVDYGRPLARGRQLLGSIIPYGDVWRTGANAATQFTTSAPITLAGINVPAGSYTLWTLPQAEGTDLIINKQTGQWGTEYDHRQDLGRARMKADSGGAPVEQFTISIVAADARRGTMAMAWGPFKWSAPIVVAATNADR
ncbi:MAG TPA: DUF2911 domain-containing protein [Gemmatimonadaceae bacterium]|jgi:hypothetical protein|nr:DUF2911 domain-containing protein [Gemmatimonadaceae bacterium]